LSVARGKDARQPPGLNSLNLADLGGRVDLRLFNPRGQSGIRLGRGFGEALRRASAFAPRQFRADGARHSIASGSPSPAESGSFTSFRDRIPSRYRD
jgi:hypothetical protein